MWARRVAAEREGFEPSDEVDPRHTISNRARSAAPAPLRAPVRLAPLDLPLAPYEHRDALAGGRDAGDRHVGRADHEVDVDLALVRALALVRDQEREALAEREVAGGVLVEQRVVEDG